MTELWDAKRCAQFLGYSYDHFRKEIRWQEGVPKRDPLRKRICGIYFLLRGREIIYVGQSVDVLDRIRVSSRRGLWGVTSSAYIECLKDDLDRLERALILGLKPKRNVSPSRPGFLCVPSMRERGSVFIKI